MKSFRQFLNEGLFPKRTRRLFHGTIVDHLPDIKENGLKPQVGKFVRWAYGNSIPLDPDEDNANNNVVFLAGKGHLNQATSAIRFHISKKLGKWHSDVTKEDIENHGALVIVNLDKHSHDDIYKAPDWDHRVGKNFGVKNIKHKYRTQEYPYTVERNNYFSTENVRPSGIIKGKALTRFLELEGAHWWDNEGKNRTR